MPDERKIPPLVAAWVRSDWIWDRRTWIMYVTLNDVTKEWAELARIPPDKGFFKVVSQHVSAYVGKGVMPPDDIASAILNVADDLMSGREATLRAGDYITIQNHIRMKK